VSSLTCFSSCIFAFVSLFNIDAFNTRFSGFYSHERLKSPTKVENETTPLISYTHSCYAIQFDVYGSIIQVIYFIDLCPQIEWSFIKKLNI
jgi:hypothetical protein